MKVFQSIADVPQKEYVVAVGMFDGMHIGHQRIVETLIEKSHLIGAESLIFTFEEHPKNVLQTAGFKPIISKHDKIGVFNEMGVNNVIFAQFDKSIASMTAEDFLETILIEKLCAKGIVIGSTHRFGAKQKGDHIFLEENAEKYNYQVFTVQPEMYDGKIVSSTWVRQTIVEGKLRLTHELLNRFYSIKGIIVPGDKRGVEVGFPTANIEDVETKLPLDGIYSSFAVYKGKRYGAMTYIGFSPTFDSPKRKIETHLFDFSEKMYGEELKIAFVARIRDEERFETIEDLKRKLMIDKNITLNILADEDILIERHD